MAAATVLAVAVTGCRTAGAWNGTGKVRVVASFYPLAEAARLVGGSRVQVVDLTPPGVEPHDLELRPQDVEAVATADVVLYEGGGFQPAVQDALGDATGTTTDVLRGLATRTAGSGADAAGMTVDPHVWLDPVLYQGIVRTVERALTQADPLHAVAYRRNADTYIAELGTLDRSFRGGLADCRRRTIVTTHAAFGYLTARYGLTQLAITGLSPEAEPDALRLAELRTLVQRDGITTIFTEDQISPAVAGTLAGETGASTAVLHPIETLTPEQQAAGADYISLMRDNLAALREALGCA